MGQPPGIQIAALGGLPVQGLSLPPLTLWTRSAAQPPAPSLDEVRAQHGIVAAAWSAYPAVLPVRFGQWFPSAADLEAAVAPKTQVYVEALERVRDSGEFSIRIADPRLEEGPEPSAASGTEYLRAAAERARRRSAGEARGREIAGELSRALGELVKGERVEPAPGPHGLASVAHLVTRVREADYADAVDRFAARLPDLRFLRTGPWPAWSFTA